MRSAVDDTGAGFASLTHIIKLAPDIIKLDLQITADELRVLRDLGARCGQGY